jgi:AcrR family transcriptional regulator
MARPVSISEERIVATARELFLEKGIRATAEEVAARLCISEASVFRRFGTKAGLFKAAMRPHWEDPAWLRGLPARVGHGALSDQLHAIAGEAIEYIRAILPLLMMQWSNASFEFAHMRGHSPSRTLKRLRRYFAAEMALGRLRKQDPEILARAYLGGLHHFVLMEMLLAASGEPALPQSRFLPGFIAQFWQGAAPSARGRRRVHAD